MEHFGTADGLDRITKGVKLLERLLLPRLLPVAMPPDRTFRLDRFCRLPPHFPRFYITLICGWHFSISFTASSNRRSPRFRSRFIVFLRNCLKERRPDSSEVLASKTRGFLRDQVVSTFTISSIHVAITTAQNVSMICFLSPSYCF